MVENNPEYRVGMGYDAHKLKDGLKLTLGGVEIEYGRGLEGHSDADVLVHAIIDALLGAAGLDDIGTQFPDSDPKYKGINSLELLKQTAGMVEDNGYALGNIDSTIVAQEPRLAPYVKKMKQNIAKALNTETSCIGIKAKTTEGMGFAGDLTGMEAHAVALLYRKSRK